MANLNEHRKYLTHTFSSGSATGKDYKTFQTKYINYLRSLCKLHRWELVNVGRNHYCFTAFIRNEEKYFNPYGAGTWLVTEAEKQSNGDWLFFCYGTNGHEWEWEYITLSQIMQAKVKVFGYRFPLERDLYIPDGMTVGECLKRYGG